MESVPRSSQPVCLWSVFVRLTELTVARCVHLRPGGRDYSTSLFIKPKPFTTSMTCFVRLDLLRRTASQLIALVRALSWPATARHIRSPLLTTFSANFRWVVCVLHGKLLFYSSSIRFLVGALLFFHLCALLRISSCHSPWFEAASPEMKLKGAEAHWCR